MTNIVEQILQKNLEEFIKERDESKKRLNVLNDNINELSTYLINLTAKEPIEEALNEPNKEVHEATISTNDIILNFLEMIKIPVTTQRIFSSTDTVSVGAVGTALNRLHLNGEINRHDTKPLTWSIK